MFKKTIQDCILKLHKKKILDLNHQILLDLIFKMFNLNYCNNNNSSNINYNKNNILKSNSNNNILLQLQQFIKFLLLSALLEKRI